ncbi:hypothetical protein V5799_003887 [Amblyomma americanum]|uniref:Uncharacterized protein n=1 Tax=Amblyomma americanum TaxID=6943 RepID=A0AAQ4D7P2_AMBAM
MVRGDSWGSVGNSGDSWGVGNGGNSWSVSGVAKAVASVANTIAKAVSGVATESAGGKSQEDAGTDLQTRFTGGCETEM